MHTSTDFLLNGSNAAFINRQKLLFDQLSNIESKYNRHGRFGTDDCSTEMHAELDKCNKSQMVRRNHLKWKNETKNFRGKESIFKRPEGPAPRSNFRNIPDYHKNPHKWTKYSLDDVSNEDMTEHSNTQAAMSFLRELRARKKKEINGYEEKMDIEPCESNKRDCMETMFKSRKCISTSQIMFKKPQIKEASESSEAIIVESEEKPIFRSSKIILPEYVIGQKPKKICKNRPVIKIDHSKELRLGHLEEPDEEEDD